MELSLLERWQHTSEVEVFHDIWERRIAFKKHQFMYSLRLQDLGANAYVDLGSFGFRYLAAVLSASEKLLAFCRLPCDMVLPT